VLENHFAKFSDLLSVTHQHFKKEDFPKGIPASAHHERRSRFGLTIFRCRMERPEGGLRAGRKAPEPAMEAERARCRRWDGQVA